MVNKPILEVRARGLIHIIDDVAPAEVLHIPNVNMPVKTGVIFMLTFSIWRQRFTGLTWRVSEVLINN